MKTVKVDSINNNINTDKDTEFNAFAKDQEKFDTSTCIRIITNTNTNQDPNKNQNQKQNQGLNDDFALRYKF